MFELVVIGTDPENGLKTVFDIAHCPDFGYLVRFAAECGYEVGAIDPHGIWNTPIRSVEIRNLDLVATVFAS